MIKMKIGILTQPLHSNYGGLLQCYALQKVLHRLGHDAWVIRRGFALYEKPNLWVKSIYYLKQCVGVLLGRKFHVLVNFQHMQYCGHKTQIFKDKYISPISELITNSRQLSKFHKSTKIDAYVVGSDQVWRPGYSPCITNYYLDFLGASENVKRIAYAASFGVDNWEYNTIQTKKCTKLIGLFDAVSVREKSGLNLLRDFLNYNAGVQVLDPTMLLEKADYEAIAIAELEPKSSGNLFYYILDKSPAKQQIISTVSLQTGLIPFTQMPKCGGSRKNLTERIDDCVFPTVSAWLRAFMDAEMIITDSFHGCVFSIIFNKPFWVVGNPSRGMARFHSLLEMFGLEDRLITSGNLPTDFFAPICWLDVNQKRYELQKYSLDFLMNALKQ